MQMLFQRKMAVAAQALQVLQAGLSAIQALVDKIVCALSRQFIAKQSGIDTMEPGAQRLHGFQPSLVGSAIGEKAIYAVFPGLFVFQEIVGNAPICGNNKDAMIQRVSV
jgi:hypothetical protein